jgi:hypothetical protein
MSRQAPFVQNTVVIAGQRFVLAQGEDLDTVKRDAVQAVRQGGDVVDLILHGNTLISALISPGVPVTFSSQFIEVADHDSRETGDITELFDPLRDYEYFH